MEKEMEQMTSNPRKSVVYRDTIGFLGHGGLKKDLRLRVDRRGD